MEGAVSRRLDNEFSKKRIDMNRERFTMYDQALLAAKNAKRKVRFDMATETSFTDHDCSVTGTVLTVDRFQIEILVDGRKVWLAKPLIAGTEVLR